MLAHYDGTLEDCMSVKDFSAHACVMIAVSEVEFTFANVFPFFPVTVLCFWSLLDNSLHNRSYFSPFFRRAKANAKQASEER